MEAERVGWTLQPPGGQEWENPCCQCVRGVTPDTCGLETLYIRAFQDGCVAFQTANLSDPATLQVIL